LTVDVDAPLHPVNWYPGYAVAVTPVAVAPAFHQLPAGVTEPPTAGFEDVVKLYCFANVALNVADVWGSVNQWNASWPSLQLRYSYRVPVSPAFVCIGTYK
jgi:hypothetical protein